MIDSEKPSTTVDEKEVGEHVAHPPDDDDDKKMVSLQGTHRYRHLR